MADLQPRNLKQITASDPILGPCLLDIVNAHNNTAQQVNASPVGATPGPTGHSALSVTGGAGYFAASITDNSPSYRGKEHFLVAQDVITGNTHMIHLGAATTWYGYLGAKTYHFASYPSYPTSGPASPIYQRNVNGAGAIAPALPHNANSFDGWGKQPFTTDTVPIR
jgi:hypothetical protein